MWANLTDVSKDPHVINSYKLVEVELFLDRSHCDVRTHVNSYTFASEAPGATDSMNVVLTIAGRNELGAFVKNTGHLRREIVINHQ